MKRLIGAALLASLVLGVVPAVPGAEPAAKSGPLSVKYFAKRQAFESAKISPTGKYLAATIPAGDQTMLGIIDIANKKVTGTLRFTNKEHVLNFWWVGPERVVATIGTLQGPLDQPAYTGEFFAMNADGTRREYLFGYRGTQSLGSRVRVSTKMYAWGWMLDPLPKEPDEALIFIEPWGNSEEAAVLIERLNVNTGARRRVTAVPVTRLREVMTDDEGRVRFASAMDRQDRHQIWEASEDALSWKQLDAGSLESVNLQSVSPDGKTLWLKSTDKNNRQCLREYTAAAGFKELRCTSEGTLGTVLLALDDYRPIGFDTSDGPPNPTFLDPEHPDAKLRRTLSKAFAGQRAEITSKTLDGQSVVVFVSSDRNPGDFYMVNRATKKADYLVSRREWIDPEKMTAVEPIEFAARDGYKLHGLLTVAGGSKVRNAPMVVMPHGGPHGPFDEWQWDDWAQWLASRGYAVLQVNYRGSGGYGEAHMQAGYRKWGTLMQDDITDGVRWAIGQGIADPKRLCIMGGSWGGYAALASTTREPDLYKCAVAVAGVYDLVKHASDSDIADTRFGRRYHEKVLGDAGLMREQSPITHIAKLKAPVLIVHGKDDKRVTFAQAKALRAAMEQHQKSYEWLEFADEGHGFYKNENNELFLTNALNFIDRHIGGAPAKVP